MSNALLARSAAPLSTAGCAPARAAPAAAQDPADEAGAFGALMALLGAPAASDEGGEAFDGSSREAAQKTDATPWQASDQPQPAFVQAPEMLAGLPPPDCAMLLAQGSFSGAVPMADASDGDPASGTVSGAAAALSNITLKAGPAASRPLEAASALTAKTTATGAFDSGAGHAGTSGLTAGVAPIAERRDAEAAQIASPSAASPPARARIEQLQRADAAGAAASDGGAAGKNDLSFAVATLAASQTTVPGSEATPPLRAAVAAPSNAARQSPESSPQTVFIAKNAAPASSDNGISLLFSEHAPVFRPVERKPAHAVGAELSPAAAGAPVGASPLLPAENAAFGVAGLHAAFTERLVDQVSWWLSQNLQSADFQIEMPAGPPVSVNVQLQGNEAQVMFRSDQAELRQLLGQALPQLREAFGSEGLLLAGVSVGVGADASSGQQAAREAARDGRHPEADRASGGDARQPPPVAAVAATRRAPWSASGGALDLWA